MQIARYGSFSFRLRERARGFFELSVNFAPAFVYVQFISHNRRASAQSDEGYVHISRMEAQKRGGDAKTLS